ncbi:MAG: ComF family protein [Ruminococcaceae bacterium]|nr:ComF family protein [Oscillospiraceae bacterium]
MIKNPFRICPFCDAPVSKEDFLCPKCRNLIKEYRKTQKCAICGQDKGRLPLCEECDKKLPPFRLAISCYYYDGVAKDGLLAYKLGHQFYKAKGFAKLIAETLDSYHITPDIITAVPSGIKSFCKMGYNPALEIAIVLKKFLKVPLCSGFLRKKLGAIRQSSLSGKERVENAKNSFVALPFRKRKLQGKTVLLIDDVYTTGSTARACSKLLLKMGAKDVYVLTLLGNAKR